MTCAPPPGSSRDDPASLISLAALFGMFWWRASQHMLDTLLGYDPTLGQPPPRAGQAAHLEACVANGTYSADHVRRYHGHLFDPGHPLYRPEMTEPAEAPLLAAE